MAYITDSFDDEIVRLLKQGGVGVLPTDTIYGLSCRAMDQAVVKKLHKLKGRDSNKPFIVLISDIKMLDLLSISREDIVPVKNYWPGPLTAILPAPVSPPWLHQGLESLAVRMPNDQSLQDLIENVGPIISTSANVEGRPPTETAEEAQQIFGGQLDFYIDAGRVHGKASTIVKTLNGKLEVIRQGDVQI